MLFIELDENAIAAQAFGFFVAGYETSSNTIAFCLYELALNQEIQERTRREIHDAIQARDGKLIYDAVQEMKYLDMVILGMDLLVSLIKNLKRKYLISMCLIVIFSLRAPSIWIIRVRDKNRYVKIKPG